MTDTSSGGWGDEIDRAMLSSMATSFRARMGFSFNADDMAELMLRCAALFAERDALKAERDEYQQLHGAAVIERDNYLARAEAAEAEVARLREALKDAAAHLVGAASAYRTYAARHISVGRAKPDPFFTTRALDFEAAAERARAALGEPQPATMEKDDG